MQQLSKTARASPVLAGLILMSCGDREPDGVQVQKPCAWGEPGEVIPSTADFDIDACRGKVVVLNFWATWCGPCRMEIPALVKLRESFPKEEVAIIGISTGEYFEGEELQKSLRSYTSRMEINYPIFSDVDRLVYRRYNEEFSFGRSIPATLVVDRHGVVQAVHRGVPYDDTGRINPYGVLGNEIQKLLD